MKKLISVVVGLATLSTLSSIASAEVPAQYRKQLPQYCQDKIGAAQQRNKAKWQSVFGQDNWLHMHHYCKGLWRIFDAMDSEDKAGTGGRAFKLGNAAGNISYSIKAAQNPGSTPWPLIGKAYYDRGRAKMMNNQKDSALEDYLQALRIEPKMLPVYRALSDHFRDLGDIESAKKYIDKGLEYSPNSASLKRRKAKLDAM